MPYFFYRNEREIQTETQYIFGFEIYIALDLVSLFYFWNSESSAAYVKVDGESLTWLALEFGLWDQVISCMKDVSFWLFFFLLDFLRDFVRSVVLVIFL